MLRRMLKIILGIRVLAHTCSRHTYCRELPTAISPPCSGRAVGRWLWITPFDVWVDAKRYFYHGQNKKGCAVRERKLLLRGIKFMMMRGSTFSINDNLSIRRCS